MKRINNKKKRRTSIFTRNQSTKRKNLQFNTLDRRIKRNNQTTTTLITPERCIYKFRHRSIISNNAWWFVGCVQIWCAQRAHKMEYKLKTITLCTQQIVVYIRIIRRTGEMMYQSLSCSMTVIINYNIVWWFWRVAFAVLSLPFEFVTRYALFFF